MRLRDGKREQAVPHQPFHEEGWPYDPHIFRLDKYTPGIFFGKNSHARKNFINFQQLRKKF